MNAMPTTFRLGVDEVDALIAESRRLLMQSAEYIGFLQEIESRDP